MSEYDETTTPGADAELIELEAPPAPPTRLERPSTLEGEELADEDAAEPTPAASSPDTEEAGDDQRDGAEGPSSSVSIRERMRQLADRPSSPGFGVAGKFTEARADREQLDEDNRA